MGIYLYCRQEVTQKEENMKKEYIKAIREMIKLEGIEATNTANHEALKRGIIDQDTFSAAARVIAKAFLEQ